MQQVLIQLHPFLLRYPLLKIAPESSKTSPVNVNSGFSRNDLYRDHDGGDNNDEGEAAVADVGGGGGQGG
jgi:hypothetical protein